MRKIIFFLLLAVFCCKCKKDNPYDYSPSLIGAWSWISTCGGLYYHCYTPESTNYNINLVFTADSMFNTYRNDTLITSIRFQTYISPTPDFPGTPDVIKYNSSNEMKFSITHDTLYLNDFCCDGFSSNYRRIR
jgi:hypothetical protein